MEYVEAAENAETEAIALMTCEVFEGRLREKGMDEETYGQNIDNYLAMLDGTGESTEIIDALRDKWMSCALSSSDQLESEETAEGNPAEESQVPANGTAEGTVSNEDDENVENKAQQGQPKKSKAAHIFSSLNQEQKSKIKSRLYTKHAMHHDFKFKNLDITFDKDGKLRIDGVDTVTLIIGASLGILLSIGMISCFGWCCYRCQKNEIKKAHESEMSKIEPSAPPGYDEETVESTEF